jgi:hypothetical protein
VRDPDGETDPIVGLMVILVASDVAHEIVADCPEQIVEGEASTQPLTA